MTRQHTSALYSAIALAKNEIFRAHCKTPAMRPATTVSASMRCMRCKGLLTYGISALDGRTHGRCSSIGCLSWRDI